MKTSCGDSTRLFSRVAASFFCLLFYSANTFAQCPPKGQTENSLMQLKKTGFLIAESMQRQSVALSLLPCLASPDAELRDGIAFEALSFWLRKDQLDLPTRQALLEKLQSKIADSKPDNAGFAKPFSALVLSELAQTDRIKAWMTLEQRNRLVTITASYISGIRDYRGFDDKLGWRHGVAHAADLAMQLALNPALDKSQLDVLLVAVTQQIAITEHSYVDGESERLLRPVLYIAKRGLHSEKEWQLWMDNLLQPAPLMKWEDAFSTSAGLTKRHNLQLFLLLMQANTLQSDNKDWALLNRISVSALKELP